MKKQSLNDKGMSWEKRNNLTNLKRQKGYLLKLIINYFSMFLAYIGLLIFKNNNFKMINWFISFQIVKIFGGIKNFIETRNDYDSFFKTQVSRIHFAIPSFGCNHYFNKGGCTMCGFNNEIKKYKLRLLNPLAITFLVQCFILQLENYLLQTKKKYDILTIFMAGSFINEEELPLDAQVIIINFFINHDFKRLCLESRPEYVKQYKEKLKSFKKKVKNKFLEIAIGYESNNDVIRNKHLRKNITQKSYLDALSILQSIDVISSTYILIGAQLTDNNSLKDSVIESILFAWQNGSAIVNLEIGCIQKNTEWESLYYKKQLELPSLWMIREILLIINKKNKGWYLGKVSDWPKPIKEPGGCDKCEINLRVQLDRIRQNHDLDFIEKTKICECQAKEKKNDSIPKPIINRYTENH